MSKESRLASANICLRQMNMKMQLQRRKQRWKMQQQGYRLLCNILKHYVFCCILLLFGILFSLLFFLISSFLSSHPQTIAWVLGPSIIPCVYLMVKKHLSVRTAQKLPGKVVSYSARIGRKGYALDVEYCDENGVKQTLTDKVY